MPDPTQDFCGATDVAFARNGHVFVSDGYCNARVIEYDASGKKLRQWGKHGTGPDEFDVVHSIAVGPQENIYVADRENGASNGLTHRVSFSGSGSTAAAVSFTTWPSATQATCTSARIQREYRWTRNSTW